MIKLCGLLKAMELWMSWVDDLHVCGEPNEVRRTKQDMMARFDCEDVGDVKEYVGCKIDRTANTLKFTQPVLLQSLSDEFDIPETTTPVKIPMTEGTVLLPTKEILNPSEQKTYRSGVGKLLHMARWSRPEIFNAVRELSRMGGRAAKAHMKNMKRVMKYIIDTPNRGYTMFIKGKKWLGDPNYEFVITGRSDSDYAKDPETRRSVSGWIVYLCGIPIAWKSKMMPIVALSVTEAELFAATSCVQDMLFAMRILESIGLKVKKPMLLECDNKGAIDLMDNYTCGGRTRHIEVKQYFIRDLKEENLIRIEWLPSDMNTSDIFTKNLAGPLFERHASELVGVDEYMIHL